MGGHIFEGSVYVHERECVHTRACVCVCVCWVLGGYGFVVGGHIFLGCMCVWGGRALYFPVLFHTFHTWKYYRYKYQHFHTKRKKEYSSTL